MRSHKKRLSRLGSKHGNMRVFIVDPETNTITSDGQVLTADEYRRVCRRDDFTITIVDDKATFDRALDNNRVSSVDYLRK